MNEKNDPLRFGKIIRDRRKKLRLSGREVARRAGISSAIVSAWETGLADVRNAKTKNLSRLAKALEWNLDDLQTALELKNEQPEQWAAVKEINDRGTRLIPKYRTVAAGSGFEDAEFLGYILVPIDEPGDIAYEVDGASMEPEIKSGDVVVVEAGVYDLGDMVVAWVPENGMVIKRLVVDNQVKRAILKSHNPDYGKLIAEGADIKGKVVEIRRRPNHH